MEYQVLNPRGDVDPIEIIGLRPRVSDLNNKTIGLYATFKEHWVLILEEIGRQLKNRYPDIKLTHFQYVKDLNSYTQVAEVAKDPEVRPLFEKWLSGVDIVITANGDAGSCALYLTYNTTLVEKLGKPVVMMVNKEFVNISKSAAELRGVPALRYVVWDIPDISNEFSIEKYVKEVIPQHVSEVLDDIVAAMTTPLKKDEQIPKKAPRKYPRIVYKGDINSVNEHFYKKGWAYGMPILPPTEDAVKEMLTGTDLPADHVVAKIPPMMGKATVEKIAVNAVMAGCRPTYMPVLIAAVEAMTDPRMWLEAYTCSVASWAPLLIINGPIRHDINVNSGVTLLSPYHKANAAIAHAIGLIVMNIAGIRQGIEDMGLLGHEGRFGICIAENEEDSPWEGLHEYYGLNKDDSAVTVFWPNTRSIGMFGKNSGEVLRGICDQVPSFGFDPGCAFILCPETAKLLQKDGYSRKAFISYIVEYARKPATEMNVRWMKGNHHIPKEVPLPADPTRSVRKFFSSMHLPVVVAGLNYSFGIAFYGGGGDHGGPITKKIDIPKNWNKLVKKYKDTVPAYIGY
jgi:hypothetical protein